MRKKIYPDPVFARNLKKLFAEKNVSQSQIASLLGRERKSVLSWVNCVTAPTVTELKKICIEYRISADELLGIKNISGGNMTIEEIAKVLNDCAKCSFNTKKYETCKYNKYDGLSQIQHCEHDLIADMGEECRKLAEQMGDDGK